MAAFLTFVTISGEARAAVCTKTVYADVVALNQPFFYNRLGAMNPAGMIFALRQDVEPIDPAGGLTAGNVQLKAYKRPRPLVLRVNAGDCISIKFQNLLNRIANTSDDEPATRAAGIHAMGLQLIGGIASDGSNVGKNPSSLAMPGDPVRTYTYYGEREGTFLMYSTGATTGGEGNGGTLAAGLFGAINVEPPGSEWYRSQVTGEDLSLASTGTTPEIIDANGNLVGGGQPIVNYDAVYADGPRAGLPILRMTDAAGNIVHSDLNAIITGPGRGRFSKQIVNGYTYYNDTPVNPDRNQPFREFTVIFHDEIVAAQAFPEFEDPVLGYTLHSVRDGFAINYGTGGIGAEILANRKGVGPMANCTECKYEEFFLTSWVLGDPAMVVDNPANNPFGLKATKAQYPDDPSNVHHSYLSDHVKFRNLHAGPKEHHIFHLHAHQWVQSPDSDNSTYLDSQAIGPGTGFTYEITYNGSGNRNKTVGDAIFHCHFYPHFAQGMWELWRNHDVFEAGTTDRKLPDAEIAGGTPNPAVIPLPTLAMAPMPGTVAPGQPAGAKGNPGYPFFVAGAAIAGHRPPTPPLDLAEDGGLPRHVITGCAPGVTGDACFTHEETRLSFDKTLHAVSAVQIPEAGTDDEKAAMAFHHVRNHPSYVAGAASPTAANFVTNGSPRGAQQGAPFADPCVDDSGNAVGVNRVYKAAAIQLDAKLNKAGWHFPQQRMLSLWGDVSSFLNGSKPPEPFFFRANTHDCITYYHTNLVPNVYKQDDFQVRTPTDVLGQHIHLVKFDVTSSDGSGNGYNYEDGTFSFQEVEERINAINAGTWAPLAGGSSTLACKPGGPLGTACARTTIQRWYADETMNLTGKDRTLRTVFTHDHFGPSTHQQGGLYAGLVIEPDGSKWFHNEQNIQLGTRDDGGPTSWQARIETAAPADSYREFMFEFADFQQAYRGPTVENADGSISGNPVNPPARNEVPLTANPPSLQAVARECPGGVPRPCPEAISADDSGTMVVNYRNEPLALRVRNPATNKQAAGDAGDLAKAFVSNVTRADPAFNTQPSFYPPLTGGLEPGDPFTPLARAYENDKVQFRVLVGAHEEGHVMSVNGQKWLHEPSWTNSGWRASQMMGISEHFEMLMPGFVSKVARPSADFLYEMGAAVTDRWNGIWGLLRTYQGVQADLPVLSSNPNGKLPPNPQAASFSGPCPSSAPMRQFKLVAVSAQSALPGGTLVYNSRTNQGGQLHDPTAILYVRSNDLDFNNKLKPGVPIEPLVLRANAGDCVYVSIVNRLPASPPDLPGFFTLPMLVAGLPGDVDFNANQIAPSSQVGLHTQLLSYDITQSDGMNVGMNPIQTAGPGGSVSYRWYAGNVTVASDGTRTATPVEFGAVNLMSADPIKHASKGAIGALVIEPPGTCAASMSLNPPCGEDSTSRASARPGGKFREFVTVYQNAVNLRRGPGTATDPAVPLIAESEDPEDSGHKAFNYRSEPMWKRMGFEPDLPLSAGHGETGGTGLLDFSNVLSNSQVGGDPQTPVFKANVGEDVRFHVVHPGGVARNNVFQVHGHGWQEQPFVYDSKGLGFNPLSEFKGSQYGIGPTGHFSFLLGPAGGKGGVTGDFLYRDQPSFQFDAGLWGIFRVCPVSGCL